MEKLIKSTTAYKIFSGDVKSGTLSHAYLLHFQDVKNLRETLLFFADVFFGAEKGGLLDERIRSGAFPDFTIYPAADKKISAEGVAGIVEDTALRPMEGVKKLYVIVGFEQASALVQNKLLKTLEEPPEGVHFILGAAALAPVLSTVVSRVKLLEIPPFSEEEIFSALERRRENPLNRAAAASANGVLGVAENMVSGGWFANVVAAANEICSATKAETAGELAAKYGDTQYKTELLSEMQRIYFEALGGRGEIAGKIEKPALIYALERITRAFEDVRFNAYFRALLYDFMLGVVKENEKWQKLQA